jgi:hypothetical protein
LPREEGTPGDNWSGERGNSLWYSNDPSVVRITGGKGIPFRNGRVDFSEWAQRSIDVEGLNGTYSDFSKIYVALAKELNLKNPTAAQRWLASQRLSPHHDVGNRIQLVPRNLHSNIRHTGGAYDLRLNDE